MKKVTLNLPDNIDIDDKEIALILAVQLYDQGKLSLGQAAELINKSKRDFMDDLGKYGVSIFGETLEDIDQDLNNV